MELQQLEVWIKSRTLRNSISELSQKFPSEEKYRLIDQIIRSSRSISANIAEGHGRYHFQENIQYCRQARGSLTDTFDHLTVAFDEKYLDKQEFDRLSNEIQILTKMINGYIPYLKKGRNGETNYKLTNEPIN